ncbi:MAG TPA: energy transducer TonB [Pyrinomonadaceae bacterium]
MTLYGLRLLVALLTFAVGTAAAWLFGSQSPAATPDTTTSLAVLMPVGPSEAPHSCTLERRRVDFAVYGGVLQSKTVNESSPDYPHYAKVARVGGKVSVKVEVDVDGRVVKAQGRGFGMLPEAAEKLALETRFTPTRVSGQPVKVSGFITYNFVLQ